MFAQVNKSRMNASSFVFGCDDAEWCAVARCVNEQNVVVGMFCYEAHSHASPSDASG
eukprot:SAG11_NODE_10345_length_838_cov_0.797023_1_plen_56_part_10